MKKRQNLLGLLSISIAAVLIFTSCTSKPGKSTTTVDGSSTSSNSKFLCSNKPVTLTAHIHWGNVYVLNDNWTITKEAAKMTNISLKGTASQAETDSKQAFNLMIASKNIPDIVGGNRDDINKYGTEGAFVPLNNLIDKYAPHIKSFLNENPDVKAAITASDGNIYQIPTVYRSSISEGWFIRKDWLDKLNLKVPTTVDELHDALKAFVTKDPNGNGKPDEVGVFTRLAGAQDNKVLSVLSLFGVSDYWHTNANGKVELGLYTPEYKQAIKNVSKWYSEGLIDKEIFTRGSNSRDILFQANNGGVIHDWIPSTSSYNTKIASKVPGFKLVGMLPPKDINGNQWEVANRDKLPGSGWSMSSNNKHQTETMKYMDFWYTDEGVRLSTYGIEGDTYTMVDGKPQYTDKVLKASNPINDYMRKIGGQIEDMGYLHDASYENFMTDDEGRKTIELYQNSGVINKMNVKLPPLGFSEKELDIVTSKYPTCRTYMLEQLQKWTLDGSSIDGEFDKYMSTLKSMGIEDVISVYQTAYDKIKSEMK
ncbi:MAG: extracellular solute-binding protein [Clostridiales bacterium]|nr:extracellular solute-binding protein [Clostridiales bacterium]